jgi:hypothetical protein
MEVKQMNRTEIHFVIDRDGNIESTIKGMKGSGCSTVAAEIENLGRVVKHERTKAFYERCEQESNVLHLARSERDRADV